MTHLLNRAKAAQVAALIALAPALLNAQMRCGAHTIQGSYGVHYTSGIPGTAQYGVGIGVASFDGFGKGTNTETVSINGTIFQKVPSTTTYTVNPDCTGTITWTYPTFGGLVVKGDLVISENGKKIYTIGTDTGSISLGVFTRQ